MSNNIYVYVEDAKSVVLLNVNTSDIISGFIGFLPVENINLSSNFYYNDILLDSGLTLGDYNIIKNSTLVYRGPSTKNESGNDAWKWATLVLSIILFAVFIQNINLENLRRP